MSIYKRISHIEKSLMLSKYEGVIIVDQEDYEKMDKTRIGPDTVVIIDDIPKEEIEKKEQIK